MRKVYGRGLNIAGQIDSTYKNYKKFTQIQKLSKLPIQNLACGYLQSFFFLNNGLLLKQGSHLDTLTCIRILNFYRFIPRTYYLFQMIKNFAKKLGFPAIASQQLICLNAMQSEKNINFTKAVFNQSAVHLFDDERNMYVIGENYFGQRATGDDSTYESKVRKVESLIVADFDSRQATTKKTISEKKEDNERVQSFKIAEVALGFQHTIVITENGEAYGCGKADYCQIQPYRYYYARDKIVLDTILKPQLVYGKRRVIKAACGGKHTILLTEQKKLYALGSNKFGQCGLDKNKHEDVWRITQVFFPYLNGQEIVDIQCGSYHTLILTNFHLYFMGSIKRNQNPFYKFKENVSAPTIVDLPSRPIKIYTQFQRTAVITEDGKVYFFGGSNLAYRGGQSGQLQMVDSFKFTKDSIIGLGFSHTLIIP